MSSNEMVWQLYSRKESEENRDMIFLKFSRHALNMKFSVGTIMGAIMEITDKKESGCLSNTGIVEKILAMQDQKREAEPFNILEEEVYKAYIDIWLGVHETVGSSVSTIIIKKIIRKLIQEGTPINENVVVDQYFAAKEESISEDQELIEGDSITIMNPSVSNWNITEDVVGPESDMTTNIGSGMYFPQAGGETLASSYTSNCREKTQSDMITNMGSGMFIPPAPRETLALSYTSNHQEVPTKAAGFGPQPLLESGITDPQPSTSSGLQFPMPNHQSICSQNQDKNSNSSSNGSHNSSGSSMPLGASASTYQGPRQSNHHTAIWCYKSLKDVQNEKQREWLAGQMLCMTVYPNMQCMHCGFKSKLEDESHHADNCQYRSQNQNSPGSSSLTQIAETAQQSGYNNLSLSLPVSTWGQSNIAQSNSGYSDDINKISKVEPIEEDWVMLDKATDDNLEDYKNELNGTTTRESSEIGSCGGPGDINTNGSDVSQNGQQQSNHCDHRQPGNSAQEKRLDPDMCKVCHIRKANRVLLMCNHFICSECVKTAQTCGVCSEPINGCVLADLSFRGQRGVLADPRKAGFCLCLSCKERLCDIVLIPCGHFVCDPCRPSVPSDGCKICGQAVKDCARKDINVNC